MPQQLSQQNILDAADLPLERVHVPEWGGDVFLRSMDARDRDAFDAALHAQGGDGYPSNFRASVVAATLCDEHGARLFRDDQAELLGRKSATAVTRLFDVAARLNGLTQGAIEAEKKT